MGSRGLKPKQTNSSTKHIKTKPYINKTIRSYIYVKKSNALTKSQYTLDIYISETNPKYNECLHAHHKTINLTFENHSRGKMIGQGKRATRDLLEDPDFVMMETIFPPQGQKRTGGGKAASEEKKSRATSTEKRNKTAAKEKPASTPHFWLGFEAMEKLAIKDESPHNPESNSMKKGRLDKEAAKLITAVHSYPHITQTLFPIVRPDGIEGQHYNLTQLRSEVETNP